jgi:hypothetical protein
MIRTFFFVLFIASHLAIAEENVGNGRITYVVKPDYISVNLAAEYIYRGYPLAPEHLSVELFYENISNIGELFQAKAAEYASQTKTTHDLSKNELHELKTDDSILSPATVTTPVHTLQLTKYFSCLEESAPLFSKYFNLLKQDYIKGDERDVLIQNIKLRLDDERALLGRSSIDGHLCGKYLGYLSFSRMPDLLLNKYLLVMKDLPQDEKINVLAAFIATFHPDSPMTDKLIFLKLVEHQMAKIYFQKKIAFDLADLKQDYLALLKESIKNTESQGVSIHQIPLNNWKEIKIAFDWSWGELQK